MKLRFIIILLCGFTFCSGQLEGYQYIGLDEFIIINYNNRISFKLNLNYECITGFKIAGSGNYHINKTKRRIKVFVDSSIDSLESDYELKEIVASDTTSVKITVIDKQGEPAYGVNACYVVNNKTYGAITDKDGNVSIEFNDNILPEYIKVYNLLNVPAYLPVNKMKSSYYCVYLKDESIDFFKGGVIELKVRTYSDSKEIKFQSIKILKKRISVCL